MRLFSCLGLVTSLLISHSTFAQNSCFTSLSDYSFTSVSNGRCIEKADFNGDGNLDLAIGNYTTSTTNQVGILLGDGDGTFGAVTTFTAGRRPLAIKAFDFNGDTFLDLAVANNF